MHRNKGVTFPGMHLNTSVLRSDYNITCGNIHYLKQGLIMQLRVPFQPLNMVQNRVLFLNPKWINNYWALHINFSSWSMIPSYGDVRVVMFCTKIFTVVSQISAYRVHRFHIWANNVHCPVSIGTYGWLAYMNKEAFSTTFMLTSSNGSIFRVTGPLWREFTWHWRIPLPKPVTRGFDVFFDLHLKKRLSKQSRRRWFEMSSHSLWRHCYVSYVCLIVSTIIQYFGNSCHWSMTVVTTTALLAGVIFQISRKRKSAHYKITYWVYWNTWWRHQMETWSRYWFCEGIYKPPPPASDVELWCFLWCAPEQTAEQTIEMLVIWDAIVLIVTPL